MRFLMSLLVFLALLIAALLEPLFRAVQRVVVRPIAAALIAPPWFPLLGWRAVAPIMLNMLRKLHRRPATYDEQYMTIPGNVVESAVQLRHQSTGVPTLGMCQAGLGMAT